MKIVLVGASNDRKKYWNIILRDLISKWHTVIPVNAKENEIEWIKCYRNISLIEELFDVINIVTPSEITLEILKQANELWYKKIWCQPWSSDNMVKKYLTDNDFDYIVDACIMMEKIN
ncbi:MAG: hypothetical protein ACD_4C00073G0001 [uncultured bacterium (gcode 4)]|uniref:CoA-binding domain-containing protein n=1 Tax=uncultured bacterium (gcode 4) TaxID=1234023 RepID=K2GUP4_9BACT|nr:MAG: hypothetical protein ACD_4C00073G0001 [uncultured bacterium (gcode 4)]